MEGIIDVVVGIVGNIGVDGMVEPVILLGILGTMEILGTMGAVVILLGILGTIGAVVILLGVVEMGGTEDVV